MKTVLLIAAALLIGFKLFFDQPAPAPNETRTASVIERTQENSTDAVSDAYANRRSDIQVSGSGVVVKVLPDDRSGSRHQRFIIKLPSGQTLLVAHNIDLAPRVSGISTGDSVAFYGEYEWNAKGGVIHWIHRDPKGLHVAGWLKHGGRLYQ